MSKEFGVANPSMDMSHIVEPKANVHYEVSTKIGISDVLEFDSLKDAVEAARKWHDQSDLKIDVIKVTEERILTVE